MRTCPRCNTTAIEFREFTSCVKCAGARILTSDEASRFYDDAITKLLRATEEVYTHRAAGLEDPLIAIMDKLMVTDFRGSIMERKILLAVLERIGELHKPPQGPRRTQEPASDAALFVFAAIDLARLRTTRFDVEQGAMAVVADYNPKDHLEIAKQWRIGPPAPAAWEEQYWKRLTRIHLGTGADFFMGEKDFLDAVAGSDPDANLYALAQSLGLGLLPFVNHEDRQTNKMYAARTLERCDRLELDDLLHLQRTLDKLVQEGNSRRSQLFHKMRRAPRITSSDFDHWLHAKALDDVGPRIIADAQPPTLTPLVFRHGLNYVFSPKQALVFNRLLQTYIADHTEADMAARAGKGFEILIARLLERRHLTTRENGRELVGVSLGKSQPHEIDVLAYDASNVYLIDAKYEMEPPGAWSEQYIRGRRTEVEKHRSKLLAKVPYWEKRLAEPTPRLRFGHNDEINLSKPLLPGRIVTPLVVSARLEPVLSTPGNVMSLVPPKAADVMRRHLPIEDFMPIWAGTGPP